MSDPVDEKLPLGTRAKAAIAKHATDIYTRLPKSPATDDHEKGNRSKMNEAITLAEMFHQELEKRGYDGSDRYDHD